MPFQWYMTNPFCPSYGTCQVTSLYNMPAGSMPLMKQLSVAIIDSNPALMSGRSINKEDPQIQGDSSTLKMLALGIMLNNIDMNDRAKSENLDLYQRVAVCAKIPEIGYISSLAFIALCISGNNLKNDLLA
ncbi:unnamed protein product [Ilex paraguariensis]|uniref:Uncharacterized protein n=1 Tax=Ilex paraguariensis TaxID=185542 RepID=A0ABC8SL74_9AQUA